MPQAQSEMRLPERREQVEENEQDREARLWLVTLARMEEAADEVGRERVCYALHISETTLSRQLREVDEKRASGRLLAYLLKHQKSGRLARWLMADYAGFLPPQRPDRLKPEEFAREVAAMALGGTFGRNEAQQILALYEKMERP